jgi:nitrite reductase/ring-hydroxylating ferredoxin subunit
MLVYSAYGLLVLHVAFGVLQAEMSWVYGITVGAGLAIVLGLHVIAAFKEAPADRDIGRAGRREQARVESAITRHTARSSVSRNLVTSAAMEEEYIDACATADIPEKRARIVCLSGERVAIFKYDGKISAVSNVCQHQNGPLGEGKILDGCITCPWHGYQYLPDTGASPPPFVENVPTFNVRVKSGRVLVHPRPNPPGQRAEPAVIPSCSSGCEAAAEFRRAALEEASRRVTASAAENA